MIDHDKLIEQLQALLEEHTAEELAEDRDVSAEEITEAATNPEVMLTKQAWTAIWHMVSDYNEE